MKKLEVFRSVSMMRVKRRGEPETVEGIREKQKRKEDERKAKASARSHL